MLKKSALLVLLVATVYAAVPSNDDFSVNDCTQPIRLGEEGCFASFDIYRWNHENQECEQGIYGGCNGSKNIFDTLKQCQKIAGKICKKS